MNDKTIKSAFFPIEELNLTIHDFISEYFKFFPGYIDNKVEQLVSLLKPNLNCYFEYPYVDKVYRDSYYNYYSTKHNSTERNCARVSFFSSIITLDDFRNPDSIKKMNDNFYGYITIRPTLPNSLGRSMLSRKIYKQNNFLCCLTSSNVAINGIKLNIEAFPHASQDGETITCAETTIWSVMEYFGMKYPEYKPVLPSEINAALANYSYERQLPSRGLSAEQISFALKEFDFGTRLYSLREKVNHGDNEAYPKEEFRRLLGYYVESGIPLIASVENKSVGHAIVIIGHEVIDHTTIDLSSIDPTEVGPLSDRIQLYDYVDFIGKYVVIDDNMPPYNLVPFDNPTNNYNEELFENCVVKNFIAPLYHKIYLEAKGAREMMISYLESFQHHLPGNKIILKLFFTSSRSFKAELNERVHIGEEANEIILNSTMPKFIWVGIFTNMELLKQSKANGLVVLDATESNAEDSRILMVSPESVTTYDSLAGLGHKYNVKKTHINTFYIFANNLKGI